MNSVKMQTAKSNGRAQMQDSGVGSESDSSPVQNNATTSAPAACASGSGVSSTTRARLDMSNSVSNGINPGSFGHFPEDVNTSKKGTNPDLSDGKSSGSAFQSGNQPGKMSQGQTLSPSPRSPFSKTRFSFDNGSINSYDESLQIANERSIPNDGMAGSVNQNISKPDLFPQIESTSARSISKSYEVYYCGQALLDKRYTQAVLPWIMADIRRRKQKTSISLAVISGALQAIESTSKCILFEHKLQTLSRFARAHQDPKFFAYLVREDSDLPYTCHVFQALKESQVS